MNKQFKRLSIIAIVCFIPLQSMAMPFQEYEPYTKLSFKQEHIDTIPYQEKIITILDSINESLLRSLLEQLVSFGPRYTGTYGCEQAASFIHDQFITMGLQSRYHNWSSFGNRYNPQFFISQNVEGTLQGTQLNEIILFGAHYDTIKTVLGANDDGSGVAAVLAAAYVLSQYSFNRTVKFVTFSGEEVGLKGSWAYVEAAYKDNDNILFNFNADMIGHATTTQGGHSIRLSLTEDAIEIPTIISTINDLFQVPFDIQTLPIQREGRGGSDYFPFAAYGYESVAFWEGEHDPNMHTQDDDLTNVNFSYLVNMTKLITGTLAYIADAPTTYPQIHIVSPKRHAIYNNGMIHHSLETMKTIVFNDIWICTETQSYTDITHVEFYYDDILTTTDTMAPFSWHCTRQSVGLHRINIIAYDKLGRKTTDYIDIFFIHPFLK
ncbi:MAG: M28 family peptidase [Thermoplasmatota archaeon]